MINSLIFAKQSKENSINLKNPKFTLDDWLHNNRLRFHGAEIQQKIAQQILGKSNRICEFTTEKVENNRDETNHCINEKVNEIEFYKQQLIQNRNELHLEIDELSTYKDRLVESLTSLRQNAFDICKKCLIAREKRLGIDLVNDNVEKELRQECQSIICADDLMSQALEQTQEQIRRLKAMLYSVDHDIENKENNLRIDRYNLTLKESNLNLSIYHGKSALNASCITLDEWKMQTEENVSASKKEIYVGKKLQSHIDLVLKQIITDLINQKNITDKAFTFRIKETKECKEKLELQHSKIIGEANEMTRNITRLEKIIAEKEGFIALAHTRLGNRAQRSGLELTRDQVENSLSKEVSDLRDVVSQLQQTLFEAQASLRFLLKIQIQLEEDINIKTNTLKIDEVDCMNMRQSIDYRVF